MNHQPVTTLVASALLVALGLSACGGPVGGGQAGGGSAYDPSVKAIPASEAENYLAIKSADGLVACGVFNVNGHGYKEVVMANFPNCRAAHYTVMCLNDKAQWQTQYVSGIGLTKDKGLLTFTSAQDGICAIFPKPS